MNVGDLVLINPSAMCWPVNFENETIVGKPPKADGPKNGAFYWGFSGDVGPHKLEERLSPREETIGLYLGKSVNINLNSYIWTSSWSGTHKLEIFFTSKHGILAVKPSEIFLIRSVSL